MGKSHEITKDDIIKRIEEVRKVLEKDPLKGWAFLQYKVTDVEKAIMQVVWPTLETWDKDQRLLQSGVEKFEYSIEPQVKKLKAEELKKLCEKLFGGAKNARGSKGTS